MDKLLKRLSKNDPTLKAIGSLDDLSSKFEEFIAALKTNTFVQELNLQGFGWLNLEKIVFLTDALVINQSVKMLIVDFSLNATLEALYFFRQLQNTTLEHISITDLTLCDEGCIRLANMIQLNKSLRKLFLYDCEFFCRRGIEKMAEALKYNRTLTYLVFTPRSDYTNLIIPKTFENIIYNDNGILLMFLPKSPLIKRALKRNKAAHRRVKEAMKALMEASRTTYRYSGIPKEIFRQMALELWKTRGQSVWWTPDEHPAGTYEEPRAEKRAKLGACVQCDLQATCVEKHAAHNQFCGSYCQWMKHVGSKYGLPDVRGLNEEQIKARF